MPEDARYRLVYEESVRALADQEKALEELRTRTGTLLSAVSISTSFLGTLALAASHRIGGFGWLAMGSFVASAFLIGLILLPTTWTFDVDVEELLEHYVEAEPPADAEEMLRNLAIYRQETLLTNEPRISRLYLAFRAAGLLLLLEILAWLIDLIVR
jgi:hypothetical protein